MVASLCDDAPQRVGKFELETRLGVRTAESDARWRRRSEVLTAWLLAEWRRQRQEESNG